MLTYFNHFFVQNDESYNLLYERGFTNVTISGDTRFDRVVEIAEKAKEIDSVSEFTGGRQVIIAGSTWEKDEELLVRFINEENTGVKFIIAPHQIHESHIVSIISGIKKKTVRFSLLNNENIHAVDVLVIDNIGMLSSLYRYGHVAYIGGGFGTGIHNILEAAAFGIPVIFGPNFYKFEEAKNLLKEGGAFSIKNNAELSEIFKLLLTDNEKREEAGNKAKKYVTFNTGATSIILNNT
jgi:3-deoxy-D-manno-octulosonic-acid transferase